MRGRVEVAPAGTALPLLAISFVTILWAGNFTAGKIATAEIQPLLVASIRILIAAAVFPLFLPAPDRRDLLRPATWKLILPLALTGIFINQFAFAEGILRTSPSHSALVHALIPVFVMLIALLFLREKPGGVPMIGMILAVAGAVIMVFYQGAAERKATLMGDLLTLLGAIAFAAYMVIGRSVIPKIGSFKAVSAGFLVAAPISIPFLVVGLVRQDWSKVTGHGIAALGYMIVAATFICYSLHMWSLSRLGPMRVAVFTNLQPILGTLIALSMGTDRLTVPLAVSGIVVVGGVALVQFSGAPASPSKPGDST